MVDIPEVAQNIYLIDNQVYSMPRSGAVYFINEERKALVEVGPPSSVNTVLEGIRAVGVRPEDIEYIVVTHIHLDHAGGAGVLLGHMPKARVVVHHKGVKHLTNPEKLIESMRQVQGEDFWAKVGQVVAVPSHRINAVREGDTIELSDRQTLRFIDAPGHAPNQICIYESRCGGVFCGEAAGSLMADQRVLLPLNSPPQFDLGQFIDTIKRLMRLKASALYYSHFGMTKAVQENLNITMKKALVWGEIVTEAMRENRLDGVAERMAAEFHDEIETAREFKLLYEFIRSNIPVCADAYIKYYQDKHKVSPAG